MSHSHILAPLPESAAFRLISTLRSKRSETSCAADVPKLVNFQVDYIRAEVKSLEYSGKSMLCLVDDYPCVLEY